MIYHVLLPCPVYCTCQTCTRPPESKTKQEWTTRKKIIRRFKMRDHDFAKVRYRELLDLCGFYQALDYSCSTPWGQQPPFYITHKNRCYKLSITWYRVADEKRILDGMAAIAKRSAKRKKEIAIAAQDFLKNPRQPLIPFDQDIYVQGGFPVLRLPSRQCAKSSRLPSLDETEDPRQMTIYSGWESWDSWDSWDDPLDTSINDEEWLI